MYLSDFSKNAIMAQQARRRIPHLGITPLGYQIWTQEEDELCQQFGSDYATLAQKLPNRSYMAFKKRCQKLGLRRRLRAVTAKELLDAQTGSSWLVLIFQFVPPGTRSVFL